MTKEVNAFTTNPHKAAGKIKTNTTFMGVSLTIFGILWAFSPERLETIILFQFVLAIPLLYISNLAYTKIAYREKTKGWDYFGWFTGTTAIAFVLNIMGILIFFLGNPRMTLTYFFSIWGLLLIYTIINVSYGGKRPYSAWFKFIYFIAVQFSFGIYIMFF